MKLKLRSLTESDYETLLDWWDFWKFNAVPYDFLPKTAYMITHNGIDVIAGFIYETNSKVCWIEFVVSNPNIKDRDLRKRAKIHLISILSELALQKGFRYIYANLKDKHLIKTYLDCGFLKGDSDYQEMIRVLY